jgi:hypothetical protein
MISVNGEPFELRPHFAVQSPARAPVTHHSCAARRRGQRRILWRSGADLRGTAAGCPTPESARSPSGAGTEPDRPRRTTEPLPAVREVRPVDDIEVLHRRQVAGK